MYIKQQVMMVMMTVEYRFSAKVIGGAAAGIPVLH